MTKDTQVWSFWGIRLTNPMNLIISATWFLSVKIHWPNICLEEVNVCFLGKVLLFSALPHSPLHDHPFMHRYLVIAWPTTRKTRLNMTVTLMYSVAFCSRKWLDFLHDWSEQVFILSGLIEFKFCDEMRFRPLQPLSLRTEQHYFVRLPTHSESPILISWKKRGPFPHGTHAHMLSRKQSFFTIFGLRLTGSDCSHRRRNCKSEFIQLQSILHSFWNWLELWFLAMGKSHVPGHQVQSRTVF